MRDLSKIPEITPEQVVDCAKVLVLALLHKEDKTSNGLAIKMKAFTIEQQNFGDYVVSVEKEGIGREWLIWSNEHAGWWKPLRKGYTKLREEAGRYTYREALEIVSGANIGLHDIPNEAMIKYQ